MTFANLTLLFGGLLTAIPIVLHLLMRRRPQRQVFPALRFLKQRRESNRRQLQIRHWLLLLLRCAAIGLLAAALARPSIDSASLGKWTLIGVLGTIALLFGAAAMLAAVQSRGRWLVGALASIGGALLVGLIVITGTTLSQASAIVLGDERAPVAAVLVLDTSPRMEYRFQNETRLELAQETATWLISQLPRDSDVAVVTTRPEPVVFAVDLSAAKKAVERLQTTGIAQRLVEVLERAIGLVQESNKSRKEVYIFTDMTAAAWREQADGVLATRLENAKDVAIYVIDVGVEVPQNRSLSPVRLSAQTLVRNHELRLQTEIVNLGQAGQVAVELYLEVPDDQRPMIVDGEMLLPEARRRERREVDLEKGQRSRVQLSVRGLEPGVHQGFIKIEGEDALAADDVRYFTIQVKEAWPVLVVAPPEALTSFLTEAIAPEVFSRAQQARYDCKVVAQAELTNHNLADYAAVCFLDPRPLTPSRWDELSHYVAGGGALAFFLGHNALGKDSRPVTSFNDPAAQRVLGGKLARTWRAADRNLFLAPQRHDHPILAVFRQQATSVPWHWSPVRMHWTMDELGESTSVVARFNNNQPALLETVIGKGRVLTMTVPVSDPQQRAGRPSWLELTTSDWPYFVLLNEVCLFMVDGAESRLNYVAGETVSLPNDPARQPQRYQLFPPSGLLQDVVPGSGDVTIKTTEKAGAYRLKGYRGEPVVRGFAVNFAAHHSELERFPRQQLDEVLGPDRYRYARNHNDIELKVGQGRVGREFFPILVAALALVLGLEQLLANRFYGESRRVESQESRVESQQGS